ncbi:MAG: TonB-dependent receptor [Comamonadaceae bacterium]|nr:MAG: TonB-dependent receptor [Comamonadaceae bacterium]
MFAPSRRPVAAAVTAFFALCAPVAHSQTAGSDASATLSTVTVNASADASAEGLTKPFAGGQVARGGRVGILGTQDVMHTPFSSTSYTQDLIRNQQAHSVGDVLQNDPSVRVARGFGNFQESYYIRGFLLSSDNVAYNGLYSLLPRQYISAELFERVEVLRGASAFVNGASPGGDSLGGAINLLPKRAANEPLTQVTVGGASGGQGYVATDISRRFGPDQSTGIRVNAATRQGDTAVDREEVDLTVASVGLDWRGRNARLSADLGYQDHRLTSPRPNVTLGAAVTRVPVAPGNDANFAQQWTYSNEKDTFGTVRGEYDVTPDLTAWAAGGARYTEERNSLAGLTLTNGSTGAGTQARFDNARKDTITTGEIGLRGKLRTGAVGHTLVASASMFRDDRKNAFGTAPAIASNLYTRPAFAIPPLTAVSNNLNDPALQTKIELSSFALADTLAMLDDSVLLTVGARRQTIKTQTFAYNTGVAAAPYDISRTSPMAGLVYKPFAGASVYANYVEGLTPGEVTPGVTGGLANANAGSALPAYVSKQKEIGAKYDGGRIGAGVAYFTTDKPRVFRNPVSGIYGPEGMDRHQGVEVTVFGEAAKGVRVLGGVTWLDAKQLGDGNNPTGGKRVIGVPKLQGNLGVEWDVPTVSGLSLDARAVSTGSSFANATNTLSVPGWTRFDLGARYLTEIAGRLVTLRGRVDNVANRDYWSSVGGFPNAGYLVLSTPRTFTVSASVDF